MAGLCIAHVPAQVLHESQTAVMKDLQLTWSGDVASEGGYCLKLVQQHDRQNLNRTSLYVLTHLNSALTQGSRASL
jgi:hypothetical protein